MNPPKTQNRIRQNRVVAELKQMPKSLPAGIVCSGCDDEVGHLEAVIDGPPQTPYEGGRFHVDIRLPEIYPYEPPQLRVTTPIYHPNVDDKGRVCLSAIQNPPKGTWKPASNISVVLKSLYVIIAEPNPDDPLMADIAELLRNDRAAFDRQAKEWTRKYAMVTENTNEVDEKSSTANAVGAGDVAGNDENHK